MQSIWRTRSIQAQTCAARLEQPRPYHSGGQTLTIHRRMRTTSRHRNTRSAMATRRTRVSGCTGNQCCVRPRTGHRLGTTGDCGRQPRQAAQRGRVHPLCGVAPIPVSSGKTNRHRLHRGGDRSSNRALHIATIVRMRYDSRSRPTPTAALPKACRCPKSSVARSATWPEKFLKRSPRARRRSPRRALAPRGPLVRIARFAHDVLR